MSTRISITELIKHKRDYGELSSEQIKWFVDAVVKGTISDAQTGAMLMAIFLNGMNTSETRVLTHAMIHSGEVLTWPDRWRGLVVDKHSTGGVGDKTSLPLVPALAACGLKVPMISGRGLGHTGGTLDKLESIPGFQISLSANRIKQCLSTVGCCIAGQTKSLVPADKIIYSLRDVTGTVESLPLIVGSILSKKGAEDLDALVLEMTYGSGAVMKTEQDAQVLAKAMIDTGKEMGLKISALMTNMDNPLGVMIGNSLEIVETVQCLKGNGPSDLHQLVCKLGGELLHSTGQVSSTTDGSERIASCLEDGSAATTFVQMLVSQGVSLADATALFGDESDMYSVLPSAAFTTDILSENSGYVSSINALTCGMTSQMMGAGRQLPGEPINHAVGLQLKVQVGNYIEKGEPWVTVHHDDKLTDEVINNLQTAIQVTTDTPATQLITGVLR